MWSKLLSQFIYGFASVRPISGYTVFRLCGIQKWKCRLAGYYGMAGQKAVALVEMHESMAKDTK